MLRTLAITVLGIGFLTSSQPARAAELPAADTARFSHMYLLHLPGIAGNRWVDQQMTGGLREAGYTGALDVYDWTDHDPGLSALRAYKRNQVEAQKIADKIAERYHADPKTRILITSHSGGTGLAVWALEKLPPDVKVETVLLMSSALSPDYDLTKALTHVTGKCYSYFSENDVLVLGTGTKMFGTIDGKKTEAAGELGFVMPETADVKQYEKLIQKPYDRTWMQYDNIGDHMGPMRKEFSKHVLAPMLFGNLIPPPAQTNQQVKPAEPAKRT